MKNTDLIQSLEVNREPDLVHRVRGLGFFKQHVAEATSAIARRADLPAIFDQRQAAAVFLSWIEDVNAQKACSRINRRDYIAFGAGMLLRSLLANRAIRVAPAAAVPSADPAGIWPQGFVATSYCLSVLDAVMEQEQHAPFPLSPIWLDASVWQSFRDNVGEAPSLAIPFLDLLIGNQPNWDHPTFAHDRQAMIASHRLH